MSLYKEIKIWERSGKEKAVCYRCLQMISNGLFYVQSADYYYKSADDAGFDAQFIELFLEEPPEKRTTGYTSVAAAITAFKVQFNNQ